jgi:Na+/melibiose symporter-like transporter
MTESLHDQLIVPLRRIKEEYVDVHVKWYQQHAPWPRKAYRIAGTVTILASLSLPILSLAGGRYQTVGLPAVGLILGIAAALNAFFSFHATWQKYRTAQLLLEGLVAAWEIDVAEAMALPEPEDCWARATASTRSLVTATRSIVTSEASKFFEDLTWPELKTS